MSELPFVFLAFGLFLAIQGAWRIFRTPRRFRQAAAGDAGAQLPEAEKVDRQTLVRSDRMGGLFWLCVGLATVWFSDDSILTGVGVFWIVVGVWSAFFASRKRKRLAAGADAPPAPVISKEQLLARAKRERWYGYFGLCLGIALVWFSDIRIGTPPAVSPLSEADSSLKRIVTKEVEKALREQSHVGLVVGAVYGDEEIVLGFGRQRLGDATPPDANSVFEIGSISKTFTGILLAKRVESGDLKLEDRVATLLPEGWTLSEAAQGVTLRHLTTHTSGFPRLPANLLGFSNTIRYAFGGDPYRGYSEEAFREAVADVELDFEPGSARSYSNFGVSLLAYILSTRNGTDYETLLKSEICEPLGMQRTTLTNDKWHAEHFVGKYRGTVSVGPVALGLGAEEWRLPNHLAGAGGIRSTGADMMRYLKANMGLLQTPLDAAIRRSHEEVYKERDDKAMGMNWIRSFDEPVGQIVIWHNGGTSGFSSYIGFTEDRRCGVFVLANTDNDVDDLGGEILEELVERGSE